MRSLIKSLPALANVIIFLLFIFMLFSIMGLQSFGGSMYKRCRESEAPTAHYFWEIDESIERLCNKQSGMGGFQCPESRYCGEPIDHDIPLWADNVTQSELIDYGLVNFDNLLTSLLTIFQAITLEGWTKIMYNVSSARRHAAAHGLGDQVLRWILLHALCALRRVLRA